MISKFVRAIFMCLFVFPGVSGEADMAERYQRADAYYQHYSGGCRLGFIKPQWISGTGSFWYLGNDGGGEMFYLMDAAVPEKRLAFDHEKLAARLGEEWGEKVSPAAFPFREIRMGNDLKEVFFRAKETDYCYNTQEDRLEKRAFSENKPSSPPHIPPHCSPDKKWEAYIREHNVWVKETGEGKSVQMSFDGTPGNSYRNQYHWSPDSRYLVVCREKEASTRQVTLVESSPADQVQPRVRTVSYAKPGDVLPVTRPVVFKMEDYSAREVSYESPEKQFSVGNIRWQGKGEYFTFDYNKRGHGEYIVYRVEPEKAVAEPLIKEQSDTFIYYHRLYRHDLEKSGEMLWISERDGWRHLYLIDAREGKVKKQVTAGEWVVKNVIKVDEENRQVYFMGCGRDQGEDPYLEKLYRVALDSGGLVCLTPENAFHQITFVPGETFFLDCHSRVDVPPSTCLRDMKTGQIVLELAQSDINPAREKGWRALEVFSSKGRDGETDIWGVIQFPPDFEKGKKYPVIEYIYAGPHDSHVPKTFHFAHEVSGLAQLGFITVMIDGMGTANRSKKFHDVCWKNLKDAGFPDRIAWMKAAARKHPEMDLERVGIYGVSAGGQNALGALLFHPEFYKAAYSACGCHDNRMDKIWWNEQWMGYPIGRHYEESSNVVNAHKLKGALLLTVGELDDNVDPSSTYQVVDALIKADKDFEFYLIPGGGHSMGGKFGERKKRDFFVRHLLGKVPPRGQGQAKK